MSSIRTAPQAAFVEEFDEDADVILPDTRRIANLSTRQGLHRQTSEQSTPVNYEMRPQRSISPTGATDQLSPIEDSYDLTPAPSFHQITRRSSSAGELRPVLNPAAGPSREDWSYLSTPSGYRESATSLFRGVDQLRALRSSSPTGATIAPLSPFSASSADGSLRTLLTDAVPFRQRRPQRISSPAAKWEPRYHRTPSYPPFQTYTHPTYHPYYPTYNSAPFTTPDSHPFVTPSDSPYRSAYDLSSTGTEYPTLDPGTSSLVSGVKRSSGSVSKANEPPRHVKRHSERPVHRFINIRRIRSDREGEDPGNKLKLWRAFSKEFPFNSPGKPKLQREEYNIIQSRLISGVGPESDNAATLTYDTGEGGEHQFETRWIHYTSDTMELESFQREILRLKEVPENAFPIIIELFKELTQVYEKPFVHGKYLEPAVRRFCGGDNDEDGKQGKCSSEIVFIAFPYLTLEPLQSQPCVDRKSVHPVRSLLQFHYSFASTMARDENQVACNARNQSDALYVPQVWMLLINDDLIVSTGPAKMETLRGNYVHLEKASLQTPAPGKRQVRLIGIQGKQYSFPLYQCRTWFEFFQAFLSILDPGSTMEAAFLSDSWRNTYQLMVGDESISEVNWLDTIHKNQHEDITICLVQKVSSPKEQQIHPTIVGNQTHIPLVENQLIPANGHLTSKGTHQPSYHISSIPTYYVNPFTPYFSTTWLPNTPMGLPPYTSPDDTRALVVRPAQIRGNTRLKDEQPNSNQVVTFDDGVRKRSAQPIQLTDLSGVRIQIPWRIGQSWANMYPVVGIKMQCNAEHRHAFIADNYVLDTPGGPITSTDWDSKVYPGISVTIRLNGRAQNQQRDEPRPRQAQSEPEREDPFVLGNGVDAEVKTALGDDSDSVLTIDNESDDDISLSEQLLNNDTPITKVNVFDYLIRSKDDAEYLAKEGFPSRMNPFRYQVRNNAWTTKETLVTDKSMLPTSPSSSPSSSSFHSSTSDSLSSLPYPPTNSPVPSSQSKLPPSETRSAGELPSVTAGAHRFRPLFEWRAGPTISLDQLSHSVDGEPSGWKPDKGSDSGVGALLEGCDMEAFFILRSHPTESTMMNYIPKSKFMQVQAEIERINISLFPRADDSDNCAPERKAWYKKEKVVKAAIYLLDSFVPLHYQKLDKSWLIGRFYGAVYTIMHGSYAESYLDHIESILSYLCKTVDQIHAGVAHDSKEHSTTYILPPALVHVFPCLVFLVCICSQLGETQSQRSQELQYWTECCYDSLTRGKYELITMARTGKCSEAKVFTRVDAEDIIAFVMRRLSELPSAKVSWEEKHKDDFNLLEMYRNHISQMEFRARQTPSSDLFDDIQQLMEECQILHLVLDQQSAVLESVLKVSSPPGDVPTKINSHCISHSQQHLSQMKHDILQLERMAEKAAVGLRYMLEVRKESNSKAITIFTIVTVIFLPLSFITSYLGMNSVDIRNGTFTQSLFWTIAIPITACLVASLWAALRFRRRIRRLFVNRLERCGRWCRGIVKGLFRFNFNFGVGKVLRRAPLPGIV